MIPRAPLLVTRCDVCLRRRACCNLGGRYTPPGWWLCRQCIERVLTAGKRALAEFARQGRKVAR